MRKPKEIPIRYCEYCGKQMTKNSHQSIASFKKQRFCSHECVNKHHTKSGRKFGRFPFSERGTYKPLTHAGILDLKLETIILSEMGLM